MNIWLIICYVLLTVFHAILLSLANRTHSRSHRKHLVPCTEEGRGLWYPTVLESTGQVVQLGPLPGSEELRQH